VFRERKRERERERERENHKELLFMSAVKPPEPCWSGICSEQISFLCGL
jgi:hypothetical protein